MAAVTRRKAGTRPGSAPAGRSAATDAGHARHGGPATAPAPIPRRVAWYALLAATALVPVATTLGVSRLFGYYSLTEDPYHAPKVLLLTILAVASTLAWLADVATTGKTLRFGPPLVALGAFCALAVASTLASPDPATSFFGASTLMTGAVTWLASAWLGTLASQLATGSGRLLQLSRTFAYAGGAVAAIALLQAAGADPLGTRLLDGYQWMILQGMSTTGNPNYTGALLVAPLALSLGLSLAETSSVRRVGAVACALVTAAALFNTLTRAAWIGGMVAAVALFSTVTTNRTTLRRRLLLVAAAVLAAALLSAVLLNPAMVMNRFTSIAEGLDAFSAGRLTLWADTAKVVAAHPVLGCGADRLGVAAYPVQSQVLFEGASRLVLQDPHSLPLLVAALFGVPAALALAAAMAIALRVGLATLRSHGEQSANRTLYAAWIAGLVGLLATSLLSVTTITLITTLFLVFGVVAAPSLARSDTRGWPTLVVGVVAVALTVTGLWGTWLGTRASHEFMLARFSDSQRHLETAMRLTPWDVRMRTQYLSLKIGALEPVLTGEDAEAARKAAASLDAEIKLARLDHPDELLLYRLRIRLYEVARGRPGYQPEAHLAAIDEALRRFPNDPEFTRLREEALAGNE